MSESRGGSRDWRLYVQDMIGFGGRALSYVEGMDLEDFLTDERTYDAVLRNIELIGEAADSCTGKSAATGASNRMGKHNRRP